MSHIKDRLSGYHDWMQDIVNRYKLVTARDFLEMIEQLQEDLEQDEKENGWIPVSERLPEDDTTVLQTETITMEVPNFSSATTRPVSKKFSKLSDATTCVAIFQGVTGAGGKINIATYSVDEDTSTISAIFSNLSNENLGGTAIFQLLQYGYIGQ